MKYFEIFRNISKAINPDHKPKSKKETNDKKKQERNRLLGLVYGMKQSEAMSTLNVAANDNDDNN